MRAATGASAEQCKRLLAELRKNCPGLIPPDPLGPGQVGPEIPVDLENTKSLIRAALKPSRGELLLLRDADNELLVDAARIDVRLGDGLIVVAIPVRCDQVRRATIQVPFAVGSSKRRAGLVAATESSPRGPLVVTQIWGEALTVLAWQALLGVAAALAAESGRDLDGAGLIPIGVTATENGLQVLTMARHAFDRVGSGRPGKARR
ncbi:MAG: hypothetical protein BroJett029_00510 [Alphaproteobacteria bacterium]|nr:MAG: hypothetical protein BroJett029_00510 [Alphaproteobacteria bacterium]